MKVGLASQIATIATKSTYSVKTDINWSCNGMNSHRYDAPVEGEVCIDTRCMQFWTSIKLCEEED